MTADLHTHTAFSDGTDTPAELLSAAVAAGLDTVAITDHDTTGGWDAAAQARPAAVRLIRGTEFSTQVSLGQHAISIHLLGYLFDPDDAAIRAEHQRLRDERRRRGLRIVEKMAAAGYPISGDQVLEIAGGAPIGRPHIGRALVAAGVVRSVDEAFATLLSGPGSFYEPKRDTELPLAVRMIARAGGVAVLAHPRARGGALVLTDERIRELVGLGLAGLEVDHPDHDATARARLAALADDLGLIRTGSSDYHGANKTVRIGQERTAPDQLDRLVAVSSGLVPVLA